MTDYMSDVTNPQKNVADSSGRLDFQTAFDRTGDLISEKLKTAPALIRRQTGHLAKAKGKMVRAAVLLACATQNDGLIREDAAKAAAAVELLHLATLVHDDIIDGADKRRGIETLNKKFGDKSAVLCGDYLLCAALRLSSQVKNSGGWTESDAGTLPDCLTRICLGELRQDQNLFRYNLSESEYFKIIEGKTAALFEASFTVGFLLSGEGTERREKYTKLGRLFGLIFQMADDCADYTAAEKQPKKPVLHDYARGVVTLPLIYAIKTDKTLKDKLREGMKEAYLRRVVKGGIEYTERKISQKLSDAFVIIGDLDLENTKKKKLTSLFFSAAGIAVEAEIKGPLQ